MFVTLLYQLYHKTKWKLPPLRLRLGFGDQEKSPVLILKAPVSMVTYDHGSVSFLKHNRTIHKGIKFMWGWWVRHPTKMQNATSLGNQPPNLISFIWTVISFSFPQWWQQWVFPCFHRNEQLGKASTAMTPLAARVAAMAANWAKVWSVQGPSVMFLVDVKL